MYGKTSSNASWISSVAVSDTCRNPDPVVTFDPPFNNGTLFPNPAIEWIVYDFSLEETSMIVISLFDAQGKLVKTLFNDQANKGENRLSFNSFFLKKGLYIIRVTENKNVLFTKKFIKIN